MAGRLMLLLLVPALAGCVAGETPNPNFLAPKVIVDTLPEGGVHVFVHSAFGERRYDRIGISVDNASVVNRALVYSAEEHILAQGFFLEIVVVTGAQVWELRARVDVDPRDPAAATVVLLSSGRWLEPKDVALPFERYLERREVDA